MAPIVASLIASGLGTLANAVVNKGQEFVEEKLGVKLEPLLVTDEGRWKLAQIENDKQEMLLEFAIDNRKVDLQFYETEVKDRGSARAANAQVATSEHSGWLNKNIMPLIAVAALSASLYGLIWTDTDAEVKYALVAVITQILNYFFGSSSLAWKQQGSLGRIGEGK
jgi:hypothetical protein